MKVDYVLGSGNHARSYLHRTAAGTLIELPLGWYPDPKPADHWAMSPGSDSDHPRTRRFVSYKCMFCHNGIPRIPDGQRSSRQRPGFHGRPAGRHRLPALPGPGGNHVRTAGSAGAKVADIRGSIVNPARLSSKLAMEVCMQCHLETTSGRIPAVIKRFNRGPFSFMPGEPLEEFRTLLRSCARHRTRREIRSGELRIPAASIQMFSGERRRTDVPDLSQSAPRAARRRKPRITIPPSAGSAMPPGKARSQRSIR